MIGAIDAVCDVAQRIIAKLQDGATTGQPPLPAAAHARDAGARPPTPAMKRFADSISRQKGVKPPPGYATSGSICRAFLDQHAPHRGDARMGGGSGAGPASPAQLVFAEKMAQARGIVVPDEAKASSAAMSEWIDSAQGTQRGARRRTSIKMPPRSKTPTKTTAPKRRSRKPAANGAAPSTPPMPTQETSGTDTRLRIPYGNKDDALKLGARYRADGWYAPAGVDLTAFGKRGWL